MGIKSMRGIKQNLNNTGKIAITSIIIITITILLLTLPIPILATNFFDERHRGWLWFEAEAKQTPRQVKQKSPFSSTLPLTSSQAKERVETFAKELEELKYIMLAVPTIENIKAYRMKEEEMWKQGTKLADNWLLANFKHPELFDHLKEPVNVHTVKMKRGLDKQSDAEIIKQFAKNFDLVLFFSNSCKYCEEFAPVLRHFASEYNFAVEAISIDGAPHPFFKTVINKELARDLGISASPTVIAVSKDAKIAFELIRGFVTLSELEEYSLLAVKYLDQSKQIGK